MTPNECQQVIDELDMLMTDTRQLIARFESTGMDEEMPDDYVRLELIVTQALKHQRFYTQEMLGYVPD